MGLSKGDPFIIKLKGDSMKKILVLMVLFTFAFSLTSVNAITTQIVPSEPDPNAWETFPSVGDTLGEEIYMYFDTDDHQDIWDHRVHWSTVAGDVNLRMFTRVFTTVSFNHIRNAPYERVEVMDGSLGFLDKCGLNFDEYCGQNWIYLDLRHWDESDRVLTEVDQTTFDYILYQETPPPSLNESLLSIIGEIVIGFISVISALFANTALLAVFYTTETGLTAVSYLLLLGFGFVLVRWGFGFVAKLIRFKK